MRVMQAKNNRIFEFRGGRGVSNAAIAQGEAWLKK
jgi:hypothetical protein